MIYLFHPDAEKEFVDAVEFYESREQGLGLDFANEVRLTIGRIVEHPHAWPILQGDVHRCQTFRFPYGVLYSRDKSTILILAIMHLHRDPDYWTYRVD